jgi:hypothetical protein
MAGSANQIFLPWVQPGLAAAIPDQAAERLRPDQPAAVALRVTLEVNSKPLVDAPTRLYGPGDVTGIDPQQVVRLEPKPGTTDFEPNYFPAIEFDRPDFPWLFTPAKADAQGRLRPWLCLVVARKQDGVELRRGQGQALTVLTIRPPAQPDRELPDLAESHLWVHAQVTGVEKETDKEKKKLRDALTSDSPRTVSRLLCPRRLDPGTEYVACVVPAFEVGRKAGLGLPVGPSENLAPAWKSGGGAAAEVTLPVYYSWEFRTGAGGDFEELAARLEPRILPPEVGKRPIDVGDPGFAISPRPAAGAPGTRLGLEGALRVLGSAPDPWPDDTRLPFQTALAKVLNAPWELATTGGPNPDPVLGPPVYGCWHAAAHLVAPANAPAPPWLNELNLDPRNRAVAALGTRVVQEHQEPLMASAWEQLGDVERINQRLRQAQLSRAVNERYHAKVFTRLPEETFLRVVAPGRSRVVLEERPAGQPAGTPPVRTLLARRLAGSVVPPAALAAPLRKLASPRGAINRVYSRAGATGVRAMISVLNVVPAAAPDRDRGTVTIDKVSGAMDDIVKGSGGFIWNPIPPPHWERVSVGLAKAITTFRLSSLWSGTLPPLLAPATPPATRAAVLAHHEYLTRFFTTFIFVDFRPAIALLDLKAAVLTSLSPARAVGQAVLAGVQQGSPPSRAGDELDPVMDAPAFPQPMYEPLRDLSQDLLFPGLEFVPPNTVQLLQTNAKFIESYMVGLNAEMGRELLWRGYPTDQRGTYFRQFWDTVGAAESELDIPPVHQWGTRGLGANAAGGGDRLVLLIRGELLRRYPNTVIYAVKAVVRNEFPAGATPPLEAYPVFRGTLHPDVTFLGFDLTRAEIVAGPGWFFVLQQQPTEPRFGLDADPFGEGESGKVPDLKSWNDLNWGHLAPDAATLAEMSHVAVGKVKLVPAPPSDPPEQGNWGRNSAHMAYITRQRPMRVAIHATELVPV